MPVKKNSANKNSNNNKKFNAKCIIKNLSLRKDVTDIFLYDSKKKIMISINNI